MVHHLHGPRFGNPKPPPDSAAMPGNEAKRNPDNAHLLRPSSLHNTLCHARLTLSTPCIFTMHHRILTTHHCILAIPPQLLSTNNMLYSDIMPFVLSNNNLTTTKQLSLNNKDLKPTLLQPTHQTLNIIMPIMRNYSDVKFSMRNHFVRLPLTPSNKE